MLRVITWRILSNVIETRHSRLIGNNYRLNALGLHTSKGAQELFKSTGAGVDFSKSIDEEKQKLTEPTKKPDAGTDEKEKLITKLSDPTVDEDRGLPPWLTKVKKCQETPVKGVNASRQADWEKCVNFCFVI